MRGNPGEDRPRAIGPGSIPACAGEPVMTVPGDRNTAVYPRVCGGTTPHSTSVPAGTGLSPRVRGNLHHSGQWYVERRSIPACAGEPGAVASSGLTMTVYPRVCGGTGSPRNDTLAGVGLSPRVRGNRRGIGQGLVFEGSIPACAGEPLPGRPANPTGMVYPRVCGGTSNFDNNGRSITGLSPRVRGNPRKYR